MSWDELPEEAPDPALGDIEMLRMTGARDITGMPLGCRIELLTEQSVRVSIGMRNHATFNQDEWLVLVSMAEDKRASPEKLPDWLITKATTRNEFKIWLDKTLELCKDYQRAQERKGFPTTVGEVIDAWRMRITRVATEL